MIGFALRPGLDLIWRVASEPQPRGLVKHVISPKRQPNLIINLGTVVAGGSGVEVLLADLDGKERCISGSER